MSKAKRVAEEVKHSIEASGLGAKILVTEHKNNRSQLVKSYSINISKGVRPVSIWPSAGTVFAQGVKRKKGQSKKDWIFRKSINQKNLSLEVAVYMAVQIALVGEFNCE